MIAPVMAARRQMTMRATVYRDTQDGTDDYGNPQPPDWTEHLTDVPCWVWSTNTRVGVAEERTVLVEDHRAIVPRGTDIQEGDRITAVTDRRDATIDDRTMSVDGIQWRKSHIELQLEVVG